MGNFKYICQNFNKTKMRKITLLITTALVVLSCNNLKDNELEVYKNPVSGKYLEKRIYHSSDVIQIETTEITLNEFLV